MAITNRFIIPPTPISPVSQHYVYPWEKTTLLMMCQHLYAIAQDTGYTGTFEEFKTSFGAFLDKNPNLFQYNEYTGQYSAASLPEITQILRTKGTILLKDIIVEPIPYYEVSNEAGGITVTIG